MKNNKSIIWGVILVMVGVIYGLNSLDIVDINLFFPGWWTLFIIVPCVIGLITGSDKTGSIIGVIIGVLLFLGANDIIDYNLIWKLVFPLIIIIVGLSLIFKDRFNSKITKRIEEIADNKNNGVTAVFSGEEVSFEDRVFTGINLTSIFGGIKCDLREAKIKKNVVINAYSFFGGTDILVPDNIKIAVSSTSIFGGVDNKKKNNNSTSDITIYVNAICIFGGVDIK